MKTAGGGLEFGMARESRWREPRAACGAIVGRLGAFDRENPVHTRLRADLGQRDFEFLSENKVLTAEGYGDMALYLARATVFGARVRIQGLGTDARKYSAQIVHHAHDDPRRLLPVYDGIDADKHPAVDGEYALRYWQPATGA